MSEPIPRTRTAEDYLIWGAFVIATAAIPVGIAINHSRLWLWLLAGAFVGVGQLVMLVGIIAKGVQVGNAASAPSAPPAEPPAAS